MFGSSAQGVNVCVAYWTPATHSSHVVVLELSDTCNEAADEADAEAQAGPAPQEHHPKEQVDGESISSLCSRRRPHAAASIVGGAQQLGELESCCLVQLVEELEL